MESGEIGIETICSKCGQLSTWDLCLFDTEIHPGNETLCDCCENCRRECYQNV